MTGIVYITSMGRPDAALALAMLHVLQRKKEARIGSVCVEGAGLGAAVFCDIVSRFYLPGPPRGSNDQLAVGFAAEGAALPDPPMVKAAVENNAYLRGVKKVTDTALAASVIRNGTTFTEQSVIILSASSKSLARALEIQGARELFQQRVKALVVVDGDAPDFPAPVVRCRRDVGEALRFPGTSLTVEGPIADAYRGYRTMPYDAPSGDMAAVLWALRGAESGLAPQDGKLNIAGKPEAIVDSFVQLVNTKPPQRRQQG